MVDAAFQGFTAIPASATDGIQVRPKRPWYKVLGVSRDAPPEVIETAGKAMQRKTHPDAGGNVTDFQDVQEAIREARGHLISPKVRILSLVVQVEERHWPRQSSSRLVTAPPKQHK